MRPRLFGHLDRHGLGFFVLLRNPVQELPRIIGLLLRNPGHTAQPKNLQSQYSLDHLFGHTHFRLSSTQLLHKYQGIFTTTILWFPFTSSNSFNNCTRWLCSAFSHQCRTTSSGSNTATFRPGFFCSRSRM